jgi:hypothetical protein
MIDREKDHTITFTCDQCGEKLETDTPSFESARVILRNEDWRVWKEKGDYQHACPGCLNDEEDFS